MLRQHVPDSPANPDPQRLPPEIPGLHRNALDIRDERFGLLVARFPVGSRDTGVQWLCVCDCGRAVIRSAASLRYGRKHNMQASCAICNSEFARGTALQRNLSVTAMYIEWYRRGDGLYSARQLVAYQSEIREATVAALGCAPALPPDEDTRGLFVPASEPQEHGLRQTAALQVVRAPSPMRYLCKTCDEPFETGFQCKLCGEGVCPGCSDRHWCQRQREQTLQEIGYEFGVTRERVRQMEGRALMKLRHPSRLRVLQSLWDGEEPPLKTLAPEPDWPNQGKCRCFTPGKTGPIIYCKKCGRTWPAGSALASRHQREIAAEEPRSVWEPRAKPQIESEARRRADTALRPLIIGLAASGNRYRDVLRFDLTGEIWVDGVLIRRDPWLTSRIRSWFRKNHGSSMSTHRSAPGTHLEFYIGTTQFLRFHIDGRSIVHGRTRTTEPDVILDALRSWRCAAPHGGAIYSAPGE